MKGKLEVIKPMSRTWWVQIKGGEAVDQNFQWDSKCNLDTLEFISASEPEYANCEWLALNEHCRKGNIYKVDLSYTIFPRRNGKRFNCRRWEVNRVIKEFAEHGFDVSAEAIVHNYWAWKEDLKSGYRDKTIHLFSPCGCNELRFTASWLNDNDKDWQTTYQW